MLPGVGHVPALHTSTRELSPIHMPPDSSSTDLVLVSALVPIPQVAEQVPKTHVFHVQSTKIEMRRSYLSHFWSLLYIFTYIHTYTYTYIIFSMAYEDK